MDENPARPESVNSNSQALTSSQRALAAARQVDQLASDAKLRQKAGIRAQSGSKGKAAALAAKQFGVSTRSVELALAVLRHGDPEILERVERGEIKIRLAAQIACQQPRSLQDLKELLRLRGRAFPNADDLDESVQDWLERLQPTVEQMVNHKPAGLNWPADPEPFGKKPCPRCPGGSIDECPVCHGDGYVRQGRRAPRI